MGAFGENLRIIRTHRELSRRELADNAGIPLGVLHRLEEGRVDPPYSLVRRLAEVLGTSAQYLTMQFAPKGESAGPSPPKLRPPPPGTTPEVSRATWQAIREEISVRYAVGEPHRIIALELGLTRLQLQHQIQRLFREGMRKR